MMPEQHSQLTTCFAYVAGELSEVDSLAIELHLAECDECAAKMREVRVFDGMLVDFASATQLPRPADSNPMHVWLRLVAEPSMRLAAATQTEPDSSPSFGEIPLADGFLYIGFGPDSEGTVRLRVTATSATLHNGCVKVVLTPQGGSGITLDVPLEGMSASVPINPLIDVTHPYDIQVVELLNADGMAVAPKDVP